MQAPAKESCTGSVEDRHLLRSGTTVKNKTPETIGGLTRKRLIDIRDFRQSTIRRVGKRISGEMLDFSALASKIKHPASKCDVPFQSKLF